MLFIWAVFMDRSHDLTMNIDLNVYMISGPVVAWVSDVAQARLFMPGQIL